ncbi:peptidase S8 and S53, subtilisin, kexin, sedolisin [Alloactinosynnema sp. L-07]|uniref:S8 family peptidase n=1 Tax=Alloactinosynnema sp. L-07 TaxID=1653480 RepID=UPI00065F0181|nr:S8 family peptidase [Alloactinosynnema sp. L-07]CRK55890.1 peptidase S8 and S53, subtilisin, kexin, sedolisin [Alloactinosynnema sp. L-07]
MKRTFSFLTALGLVLAGTAPAQAEPTKTATPTKSRSVTLITGDRVVVPDGGRAPSLIPGKGRERIQFRTQKTGGHLTVIPADAMSLVADGTLDRRLFDVTGLLDAGYDDTRADLPLIITGQAPTGMRTMRELPAAKARAVSADKSALASGWQTLTRGGKVWLDGKRKATLDRSAAQIGAPQAWQAGLTGAGVKVAVLDTGVDQTHPDLAAREVGERNFTDSADAVDRVGHGTHVGSIIAGGGAKYRGVADGARLLDGKVLNDQGYGLDSWIIAGMEWAVEQGADIVNLSLGGEDTPDIDPVEAALNRLSAEHGTLFVVAAGNSGPSASSVGSPGSADAALTVGSVERDDSVSFFSSRGPRIGDSAVKPDVTAPGSEIAAAKAAEGVIGNPVEPGYVALSGTSMATPHVAGAAALLAQKNPQWTGARIKAALTASARPTAGAGAFDQGSGRIDVPKALAQNIVTEPTSVSLGLQQWPHDDDQPVTKDLAYRNDSDQAVTFDLTLDVADPQGKPAPAGMFTLSQNRIEVPAGGTATIRVTADTRMGTVDGVYSGSLTAKAGEVAVRTPVAVNREVESYQLKITYLGPDGKPSNSVGGLLVGMDSGTVDFLRPVDGVFTKRVPKGKYLIDSFISDDASAHHLVHLGVDLTKDTEVVADARATKPLQITPPVEATPTLASEEYVIKTAHGFVGIGVISSDPRRVHTGQVGPAMPTDQLTWTVNTSWETTDAFYGLAWSQGGSIPTGWVKQVRQQDLATVRTEVGRAAGDHEAVERLVFPRPTSGEGGGWARVRRTTIPTTITEHLTTDGMRWSGEILMTTPDPMRIDGAYTSPWRDYRANRTYQERMNVGIYGPAMPDTGYSPGIRYENRLGFRISLFGDGGGNSGYMITESANTTLYRDGVKIGESDVPGYGEFEVPAERGRYRLTTDVVRPARYDVSTKMSAAWTFESAKGDTTVPLSTVRFHANLDATNSAPGGRAFALPVTLQRENGSTAIPRGLSVDVSFDEGATWRKATVVANSVVLLHHPAGAKSVSLRAKASDGRGGTVEQTIVRAYKLK